MSLRRCLPFAMLIVMPALAAVGGINAGRAKSGAREPGMLARASMPAMVGGQAAIRPGRWLTSFRRHGNSLPASLAPIQFKDPKNLGLGKLLVASRSLADPAFAETVVLLVHYDDTGVLGLILNRRTDLPLSRVLDLKAAKGRSDPVYLGGPLQPSAVFALSRSSAKMEKAQSIFPGVYLISDKGLFEQALSARPDPGAFRVYMGYAGWTKEQLQAEVQSGAWFVLPADAATVFNPHPESLWLQMIQKTKLRWAKGDPPARIFRQPNCFDRFRVIRPVNISDCAVLPQNHQRSSKPLQAQSMMRHRSDRHPQSSRLIARRLEAIFGKGTHTNC